MFESEWRRMQKKLNRLMHDQLFARRILDVPDIEWRKTDDNLKKRLGLFQSSNDDGFKVYFKSYMSVKKSIAGVGVAIYDARDRCVFELGKQFSIGSDGGSIDGDVMVIRSLIEGLHAALEFGLKRVDVFCDNKKVYHYLTGKERSTNKMTNSIVDSLILIMRKIGYPIRSPALARQKNVKFAYQLAKNAIALQAHKPAEIPLKQCTICFDYIHENKMFCVKECLHEYCFSCMNKHVESKLLHGRLPKCPHENCYYRLEIESCKNFLTKKSYDTMRSRVLEASIRPADRLYCPFSNCSFLMSKTNLQHSASSSSQETGKRECVECYRAFCISCKVQWHDNYTCSDYMKSFPNQYADEERLKSLATSNHWRQCFNCKHMIELAAGCHHISCRCGYEFCYRCGAVWDKTIAKCSCPSFDLRYVLYDTAR